MVFLRDQIVRDQINTIARLTPLRSCIVVIRLDQKSKSDDRSGLSRMRS